MARLDRLCVDLNFEAAPRVAEFGAQGRRAGIEVQECDDDFANNRVARSAIGLRRTLHVRN